MGTGVAQYRAVLRLPGVAALSAVALAARVPASAAPIVLTLHVVIELDRGYSGAGLVAAASTVGMALGAPLLGRLVDRRGLRTMAVLTLLAGAAFWSAAPWLPFPALLGGALLAGALSLPVYSVVRQSLGAMVPPASWRPAYALDSMSVELSYMTGPALGTALAVGVSTTAALLAVGAGYLMTGVALWLLDPPTRREREAAGGRVPLRSWFTPRLAAVLLATVAATTIVLGSELGVIASLERGGEAALIGAVIAVWSVASLVGGWFYGAARRAPSVFTLVAGLGIATVPAGLGGPWWTFALLFVPAGLLCAPTLAASADAVAGLTPDAARGLVTGLHGSATTLGSAVGTPLAGVLIDRASPAVAVAVVGLAGALLGAVAALVARVPDRSRAARVGHTGG